MIVYKKRERVLNKGWVGEICMENSDDEEQKMFAKIIVLSHCPVFDSFKVKKL